MKTLKRLLGDKGEDISCDFLKSRGHKILSTNYQKPWGEIDIVSSKGKEIHFIEVKTQTENLENRKSFDFYEAEEKITYQKRMRLRRIIQTYLLEKKLGDCDYFIDVIALYLKPDGGVARIEYIEDITL